jgi:hypothetical protein
MRSATVPQPSPGRKALALLMQATQRAQPELNGRPASAAKLILTNDVTLLDDGTAHVASGSNPALVYTVTKQWCECVDFTNEPAHTCKHRLAFEYAWTLHAQGLWVNPDGSLPGEDDAMAEHDDDPVQPHATPRAFPAPPPAAPRQTEVPIIAEFALPVGGLVVSLKLCDTDDVRMMERILALMAAYPPYGARTTHFPSPPEMPTSSPQNTPPPASVMWTCPSHGSAKVKPSDKTPGEFFCAYKGPDKVYCKETSKA